MKPTRKRGVSAIPQAVDLAALGRTFAQQFLDVLEIGVAHVNSDGEILYSNTRFTELLGGSKLHRVEASRLTQIISSGSWRDLKRALQDAVTSRQEGELQVESADGLRTIRIILAPIDLQSADTIQLTAVDTTDLVRANEAVRERESALQLLTARILRVQDQERRRIARDLHDVTGQELVAISLSLSSLARIAGKPGADLQKEIADCMHYVRKVEEDIRTLSYILHPPLLDELGLGSALAWYVEGFNKRSGVNVEMLVPAHIPRLPIERETALFRIVQEGLTNVLRHSRSSKARLRVVVDAEQLVLSVEDEGPGIEPRKVEAANTAHAEFGVGIPGMRERLKQYGGSLQIRSGPDGTQLIACMPLRAGEDRPVEIPYADEVILKGKVARAAANGRRRILIADDHEVARRGIRDILAGQPDIEVVGEAQDGIEAVSKTRELEPDLIVLDLSMPKVGGLTAAKHIRDTGLPTRILIFSTHSYPGLEHMVQAAGCQGFVEKSNAGEDLLRGIRALLSGHTFYHFETLHPSEPQVRRIANGV